MHKGIHDECIYANMIYASVQVYNYYLFIYEFMIYANIHLGPMHL